MCVDNMSFPIMGETVTEKCLLFFHFSYGLQVLPYFIFNRYTYSSYIMLICCQKAKYTPVQQLHTD